MSIIFDMTSTLSKEVLIVWRRNPPLPRLESPAKPLRGIEQGIEQGRAEGQRELLRHAVIRRFGAIPSGLVTRIADADSETLATLFDHVLVAATLDDI